MYHLKKTLIRYLIILKIGGQQPCSHYGRGARGKKSTVKCTKLHSKLDTGAKSRQRDFRWVIQCVIFIEIVQYRRHVCERAWNVAVLTGKTQVMGKRLGQVRTCPPQFQRWIEWLSKFRGLEENTWSADCTFHRRICKFIFKRLLICRSAGRNPAHQIYYFINWFVKTK